MPEGAGIWSYVTSTRENCLGSECPHYDRCFVMEARKQALASDVVVVNHHLFFADLVLRDEGAGELIAGHGLFASLHTDRGNHYWLTPEAGGKVDKTQLTQFGRAMHQWASR